MANFEKAVKWVLDNEGGLNENPHDLGGITNKGISLRFLKLCGLKYDFDRNGIVDEREIRLLTDDQAIMIYQQEFWCQRNYEGIREDQLATYIFDAVVNMGPTQAIKLLQRAIWALNAQMNYIDDDGILGQKTIAQINRYGMMLLPVYAAERAGFYRLLAATDPTQGGNLGGWLKRAYTAPY
jgi:lysozyme family protein